MKTAISLPDQVFRKADRLAKKLRKSRSELYRDALLEYLKRHQGESAITEAVNAVVDDLSEDDLAEQKKIAEAGAATVRRQTRW